MRGRAIMAVNLLSRLAKRWLRRMFVDLEFPNVQIERRDCEGVRAILDAALPKPG
jgi:hypothetical protein